MAAIATNVFIVADGKPEIAGGTSASAPLWAGLMALINQYGAIHNARPVGFANRALYAIGLTRGQSGPEDVYSSSFHDIADGLTNTAVSGFPSVAGYDLTTGLGTPSCGLIQQLGTSHPTAPQSYTLMSVHIVSGNDGVADDTPVYFYVLDQFGQQLANQEVKLPHTGGWGQGTVHDVTVALPAATSPYAVGGVQVHMGPSDDNWDITGLQVAFGEPGMPSACIADLSGENQCAAGKPGCTSSGSLSDGHTGITALSQSHPDAVFLGSETGCPAWGGSVSVGPLYDQLEFIIDTGDDDLDNDAELDFAIIDQTGSTREIGVLHALNAPVFDDQSQWQVLYTLQTGPIGLGEINSIILSVRSLSTFGEEWNVNGIEVWAIDSTAPWERVCYMVGSGNPEFAVDTGGGHPTFTIRSGGCTF